MLDVHPLEKWGRRLAPSGNIYAEHEELQPLTIDGIRRDADRRDMERGGVKFGQRQRQRVRAGGVFIVSPLEAAPR